MTQPSLLDWHPATRARDEALSRVEENACDDRKARAEVVVSALIASGDSFSSDDVWQRIEKPREARALGALLMRLAKAGLIERVGFRATTQASRHAAPVAVWRRKP